MKLFINKQEVPTNGLFAFDGCHKIYILENDKDLQEAIGYEYEIRPVRKLLEAWNTSCGLRFIDRWNMDKFVSYIPQGFEDDVFIDIEGDI